MLWFNKWHRLRESKTTEMGSTKYDIEKFSGKNDFGLWRIKMRAILVQRGLVATLRGESGLSADLSPKEKNRNYGEGS